MKSKYSSFIHSFNINRKKKQKKIESFSTMKFGTLTAILTFCAGATFTLVDIGTDVALAYEYWNGSYFVRPYLLCNETSNGLCPVHNSPYAILTTVWIGLGGSIQFLLVAYFLRRGDDRLYWLPEVAFLVTDNRVFNGPLGRSLPSFARTTHSAHSLRSTPLCFARSLR